MVDPTVATQPGGTHNRQRGAEWLSCMAADGLRAPFETHDANLPTRHEPTPAIGPHAPNRYRTSSLATAAIAFGRLAARTPRARDPGSAIRPHAPNPCRIKALAAAGIALGRLAPSTPRAHAPAPPIRPHAPNPRRINALAVAVAGLLLATTARAADLPVTAVTLSNAGLAQIERAGPLPPGAPATLTVPLDDVDDVLKTLLVQDPTSRVEAVRLPAQDLEAEAFRGLPLTPADLGSPLGALRALRGQAVTAGDAQGRLLEVEATATGPRLLLLTATGLRSLTLADGATLTLADSALAARLARATEALAAARAGDTRTLEIRLAGATDAREVRLTTVTAAPLWKPSWRLLLPAEDGAARLQGWAVVENRSGADWPAIRLALVSGNPASYRQALYAPIRLPRPELPVRGAEALRVEADTGARPAPPLPPVMAAPAPMAAARGRAEAADLTQRVAAVPTALAESAAGRVAFTLPDPVTVLAGETANLPFLDTPLPAERLRWVQDTAARHPLLAVRIRNASGHTLPDGLATLYGTAGPEAGAFLGEAELRALAPDETRLLGFARDRDAQLTTAHSTTETPARITLRRGTVVVGTLRREEVALAIDPRGTAGRWIIDLPRRQGTPRFAVAQEGDFGLRHEARLDGTPTTLRFAWEREGATEYPLWDAGLGDPILLRWREADLETQARRLPGGPGTLERLRDILARLPVDAPGRADLAAVTDALAEARRLLDAARPAIRAALAAEAALARARAALDDRTGTAREEARQALNAASLTAARAGAAADTAWEAWQRAVAAVLARSA